jgi:hypothetical protein
VDDGIDEDGDGDDNKNKVVGTKRRSPIQKQADRKSKKKKMKFQPVSFEKT